MGDFIRVNGMPVEVKENGYTALEANKLWEQGKKEESYKKFLEDEGHNDLSFDCTLHIPSACV